jgi:hypothetical protein
MGPDSQINTSAIRNTVEFHDQENFRTFEYPKNNLKTPHMQFQLKQTPDKEECTVPIALPVFRL